MNIKVLDCTLRDGGYINDWEFGKENIKKIVNYLTQSEIDIIECGFLSNKREYDEERSIFDTVERFTNFLPKNKNNQLYVCMVNYGEYKSEDIPNYDKTKLDGIRVAFHKKDKEKAVELCKSIKEKGYKLFIQPMVTINYTDKEIIKLVEIFNEIKPYAFYIADSFGVMKKNDLLRMFYLIDNNLDKKIKFGYHSHNNIQLAYSNSQTLIELRTDREIIIDSSVFGMGRGAGNLNTELFIQHLNETIKSNYYVYPLLKIIDEVLNKIYKNKYWGYSLPYYLSSNYNCHPNYATHLSDKNTLTINSISEILSKITIEKKGNFDQNYIEDLYLDYQKHYIDDTKYIEKLAKDFYTENVLLIAPGKSIKDYIALINDKIKENNLKVISINFIPKYFNPEYIFISNEKRFEELVESGKYNPKDKKYILTSNVSNEKDIEYAVVNYLHLLNTIHDVSDNSTLMLLKLLKKLKVNKIYLAGFDGYSINAEENYANKDMILTTTNEKLNLMNQGIVEFLNKIKKELNIEFITPTKYNKLLEGNY